jgi:hypothetical protein
MPKRTVSDTELEKLIRALLLKRKRRSAMQLAHELAIEGRKTLCPCFLEEA